MSNSSSDILAHIKYPYGVFNIGNNNNISMK